MTVFRDPRTGSSFDEASVVRLVYSTRQQPEMERNIILISVRPHLQTALYRVINIVEKTLQVKGIFTHSMSLLSEHEALADLLAKRTDITPLWEYLLDFYKTTIDKIPDHLTVRFYSQLVALLDNPLSTAPDLQPIREELPAIEEAGEERAEEAVRGPSVEGKEVEIMEEACVAGKELSAFSVEFLESFTGGLGVGKELKGKAMKRLKVGCLQPGEPMQKWQYYDSLEGGLVKVVFTSKK